MKRALLLLQLLTTAVTITMATINSSTFQQQQMEWFLKFKDYKIIQEPSHPVFSQGQAFYWLGSYTPSPDHPQTCIILASHPEWPFDGAMFRNGSLPSAAVFGCRHGKMCRGAKCVEQYSHLNVVTYTLVAIVAFLLVCLVVAEPRARKQSQEEQPPRIELYERPRRRSPREPSFDSLFAPSPHEHRVRFEGPPEYTE